MQPSKMPAKFVFNVRMLAIFFLVFSRFPAQSCTGPGSEIQNFSDRCRQMADCVREICRLRLTAHESAQPQVSMLLNTWIDVYISHGHEQPPEFASVTLGAWRTSLNDLGYRIGAFARDNKGEVATASILLSLDLHSQPPMLFSCHGS